MTVNRIIVPAIALSVAAVAVPHAAVGGAAALVAAPLVGIIGIVGLIRGHVKWAGISTRDHASTIFAFSIVLSITGISGAHAHAPQPEPAVWAAQTTTTDQPPVAE